jgi:hypothetical protein
MKEEFVYAVVQPYFEAVRDIFLAYAPERGVKLTKCKKTKLLVDAKVGRGGAKLPNCEGRHFAATRDDGLVMYVAPRIIDLPEENVVAILSHEFGHAIDHLYPAHWIMPPKGAGKATWIGPFTNAERQNWWTGPETSKEYRSWQRLWSQRSLDQIEWAADGIAYAITGREIGYCGDCMVQCYSGTNLCVGDSVTGPPVRRPAGLR